MIILKFNSTKERAGAYQSMQHVADDIHMLNKVLNQMFDTDLELPCPSGGKEFTGIANASEIWFGTTKPFGVIDLHVKQKKSIKIKLDGLDEHLTLLIQMAILSLCEQFIYTTFVFDQYDSWTRAINIYEDQLGPISKNAAKALGLKERV